LRKVATERPRSLGPRRPAMMLLLILVLVLALVILLLRGPKPPYAPW
jgi:hypothetical protein